MGPGGARQLDGWRAVQRRRLDAVLPELGYYCLHGATAPSGGLEIDHLVIGSAGSFLIVDGHFAEEIRKGFDGRIWCGGTPIEGDLDRAHTTAAQVAGLLGSHVSAVLAVHEGEVKTPPVVRAVYLVAGRDVAQLIAVRPPHRSPAEVAQVAARARNVFSGGEWTELVRPSAKAEQRIGPVPTRTVARPSGWRSWFRSG